MAVGQEGTSPFSWPAAPRAAGAQKEDQESFFPERSGRDKVEKGQPCSSHQGRRLKNGNIHMVLCKCSAGNAYSNITGSVYNCVRFCPSLAGFRGILWLWTPLLLLFRPRGKAWGSVELPSQDGRRLTLLLW